MFGIKKFLNGLKIVPKTATSADSKGELEVINSTGKLGYHNGTSVSPVVTESHSATLTNKTIDADSNTITNIENADIKAAAAIDASKIADGSVSSTEFQYINSLTSNAQTQISAAQSTADNHISDAVDAHDASAISSIPSGNLAATEVQAALNELQTDVDTRATSSALTTHINNTTGAHAASAISSTPSGNLAAIEVQAALNELQTDVDTRATSTALTTHTGASTGVHGVTGSVVGTSDTQTLTNKTITGADIRTPVRSDVKQDTKANLTTYALTASNGQLCFATDTKEMFQVVDTLLESVGGGAGIGGVDILFSQTFEEAALTDFTQTGLSLSTSSPLHGAISALMTHQAATSQSFKQVIAVDEKFRGQAMLLELNVKSTASAGNVTLKVYDETNAANIVASEQLTLSSETAGIKVFSAFTIPVTCLSLSYTITALPEAGSPVTRIDDILCQLNNASLLETSVTVPNITAWQGYTPTFQGFGTPTAVEMEWRQVGENVEIRGKFTGGTSTAVEARIGLPSGLTSSGTGLIPSIQIVGTTAYSNQATTYFTTAVLIEPSVAYMTLGQQSSIRNSLTKVNGNVVASSGEPFSLFASVPCAGLTATSDVAIPLTQSGIVQEADSMIRLDTANGYGSTNTMIRRFSNITQSIGSDITYSDSATLGATFTVQTDGIYDISFTDDFSGAQFIGLSKNSTALTTSIVSISVSERLAVAITSGASNPESISWTGYLVTGDIVRAHNSGQASGVAARTAFSMTKQGSLKQVTVNTNSKITIPTSELRFEGASARGAVATAVVKFDTMAKIRGDAFTVTNTANDGTYVTMTKAGRLSISASCQKTTSNTIFQITKNQTTLTSTTSTASEILVSQQSNNASGEQISSATTVNVSIGDIIRVCSNTNPAADPGTNFNLSFQEQDIQVSVSNTLPQFSESDSCVRVTGGNGFTGQTRLFSNVIQNIGSDVQYTAASGQFRAMSSGIYNITYQEESSVSSTSYEIYVYINETLIAIANDRINTAATLTRYPIASIQLYLSEGDIVTGRVSATGSFPSVSSYSSMTMTKVGKPNVTGVDVTPFVNIPQPESQSLYLINTTTTLGALVGALTSNSGSSILSYNSATGVYTALKACRVSASFTARTSANTSTRPLIFVDANLVAISTSVATTNANTTTSFSGSLNAGQTLSFSTDTTSSINNIVSINATALSDQILTAPETFSTDTAALTYAGSGTYTLATLANAKVGTFITYTYAALGNVRTQTTTAPTQTTADMNANGILIYARPFNAASTAAQPAAIAINIGKGLKGKSVDLYKSAAKVNAGATDFFFYSTNGQQGLRNKEYTESTGILFLDAGISISSAVTAYDFAFSDLTSQASGYLVINASKNVSLTGMNIERVSARAVNTAGTSFNATGSIMVYDSVKTYDTHEALNAATGVFTAPETGYYTVQGQVSFVSAAYTTGQGIFIEGFKNGVRHSLSVFNRPFAAGTNIFATSYNDSVFLAKNETFKLNVINERGATTLNTGSGYNFFSITKTNIGGKS